jgi:hypothetical protein
MDAPSQADPLEQLYLPPLSEEERRNIGAYRERLAAEAVVQRKRDEEAARAARTSLPRVVIPPLHVFLAPPTETPASIEERVQRLIRILDALDQRKASATNERP